MHTVKSCCRAALVSLLAATACLALAFPDLARAADGNAQNDPAGKLAGATGGPDNTRRPQIAQSRAERPEPPADPDGRLALIRQRGTLIVGVKADYPPWGMVNDTGQLVGMEADLAKDIAETLGVDLQLTAVTATNRLRKLQEGSIDLVIATMGDTSKRREIAGLLLPHYYASGVALMTPESTPFTAWGQLRGRSVCLTAGAYYNRTVINRYLVDPKIFKGTRDTRLALRDGRCVGWAYDNTSIARLVNDEAWSDYDVRLPTILSTPWSIAVKKSAADAAWGRFVSDMIVFWHRSGHLLDVEQRWGLPESGFLREQHNLWSARTENGDYICERLPEGGFPDTCVTDDIAETIEEDAALSGVARFLKDNVGLDLSPIYDNYDRQRMLKGLGVTLMLSIVAIVGSLAVGLILAILVQRRSALVRFPVNGLITLARMTPPILQLYILFFGLGGLLASGYGVTVSGFLIAGLVLSLYAGASNAAILSTAFHHLRDEGRMNRPTRALAKAIDRSYDGLVANSVNIVKAAGLASTIAVPELISATNGIISARGNAPAMMNLLLIFYFVFVLVILFALKQAKGYVTFLSRPNANDHLALLADMTADFAQTEDVDQALHQGLGRIAERLDAEAGSLFVFDPATGELVCRACVGPVDVTGLRLAADHGIVGRAVQSGTRELVDKADVDTDFAASVDEQTGFVTRSILAAPLKVRGKTLGAIELINKRPPGTFDDTDGRSLETMAAAAALALLNARSASDATAIATAQREQDLVASIRAEAEHAATDPDAPVQAYHRPANGDVSGFYDIVRRTGEGRTFFMLGEARKGGVDGAIQIARATGLFSYVAKTTEDPARILDTLNAELGNAESRAFETLACGIHDSGEGVVKLACSGDMPSMRLLTRDGDAASWSTTALPGPSAGDDGERHDPPIRVSHVPVARGRLYILRSTPPMDGEKGTEGKRTGSIAEALEAAEDGTGSARDILADAVSRLDRADSVAGANLTLVRVEGSDDQWSDRNA